MRLAAFGQARKRANFANGKGNQLALGSLVNRVIFPALNRCEVCGQAESEHKTSAQKQGSHL
jgi:hypothetical protein